MVKDDGYVHDRQLERMVMCMATDWEDGFVYGRQLERMDVHGRWLQRMAMCPWQTVGDDSYIHVIWFMSMMVGEDGYWLCPWQMVVEDGYVSMADSWR